MSEERNAMNVREAEGAVLDAMAAYMRAGGYGEELVEMAQREAEWWEEERAALAAVRGKETP